MCVACATWPGVGAANPFRSPGSIVDAQTDGGALGESIASSADGTVAVVPSRPSGSLSALRRTRTSITFVWGPATDDTAVVGYRIYEYGAWFLTV
jgi:hypothetical protein